MQMRIFFEVGESAILELRATSQKLQVLSIADKANILKYRVMAAIVEKEDPRVSSLNTSPMSAATQ